MNTKEKKSWYKKWWVWVIIIIVGIAAISATADNKDEISDKVDNASKDISDTVSDTKKKVEDRASGEKKADVPAEYTSALNQADSYANTMHMSKQGVYDQLVSEYGGQFSAKAAKYATDNVKADWKKNALQKAKDYQSQQSLSPEAIRDQLTSSAGEKFTQAEADYAIAYLND